MDLQERPRRPSTVAALATKLIATRPDIRPPSIAGALTAAMATEHLALVGTNSEDCILLWARRELTLGKLREAPVDCCLRCYPVEDRLEECRRISRQHLRLECDDAGHMVLRDLASYNGSELDGIRMQGDEVSRLDDRSAHLLRVGDILNLRLRVIGAAEHRPRADGTLPPPCDLDHHQPCDAVTITRPGNRPELAYALVLRRLSLGGPSADLVLAGARSGDCLEVARHRNRWIARTQTTEPWRPITLGSVWRAGGIDLRAAAGSYEHID